MKITGPDTPQQAVPENAKPVNAPHTPNAFKNILQQATGRAPETPSVNGPGGLAEPRAVSPFPQAGPPSRLIDKTDRVIDLMDAYSQSLADPRKTLKEIEPVLMDFVRAAESLHDEYAGKPDPPEALGKMAADLLRTAQIEQVRFRRGDYVGG